MIQWQKNVWQKVMKAQAAQAKDKRTPSRYKRGIVLQSLDL